MWFLFLVAAIAYATKPYDLTPIYRNELRHLPEKMKRERIKETIYNTFLLIQDQVMQAAIRNERQTNFTLFCIEPNDMSYLFRMKGATYYLVAHNDTDYEYLYRYKPQPELLFMKPRCLVKDGYELYNRHYQFPQHSPDYPYPIPLDFTSRNKVRGKVSHLEQEPILYVQQFFQLFNQQFPDLTLAILHDTDKDIYEEVDSKHIFENDCCPLYIVSW